MDAQACNVSYGKLNTKHWILNIEQWTFNTGHRVIVATTTQFPDSSWLFWLPDHPEARLLTLPLLSSPWEGLFGGQWKLLLPGCSFTFTFSLFFFFSFPCSCSCSCSFSSPACWSSEGFPHTARTDQVTTGDQLHWTGVHEAHCSLLTPSHLTLQPFIL